MIDQFRQKELRADLKNEYDGILLTGYITLLVTIGLAKLLLIFHCIDGYDTVVFVIGAILIVIVFPAASLNYLLSTQTWVIIYFSG